MSKNSGDDIISMLSPGERKLLEVLSVEGECDGETLSKKTDMDLVSVSRNALWLSNKKLVDIRKEPYDVYELSSLGAHYLQHGLPERILFGYLIKMKKVDKENLTSIGLSNDELNAAIGILSKSNIVRISKENDRLYLILLSEDDIVIKNNENALNAVNRGEPYERSTLETLCKRKILSKKTLHRLYISLTEEGKRVGQRLKEMGGVEPIEVISRDVIESKIWETRPFRKYDILSPVPRLSGGRIHPLTWVMNMVREVFVSMGFEEYEGPWIETSFWNMDAMFIPQHHPARDVQDTFYLNEYGKLPGNEIIAKVKAVHENGWKTGSIGYGMPWNPQTAMMLVLRSHTTAVTYRLLAKGVRPPIKVFSIGRVFRNETPDPLHLPEFHQIEGFVYAKGLTLRHLMGYLKTFYEQFGITKLRFKPTYNPYTEPSMEIYAFNPAMNKWIEVANSGVFRPEATLPYGIKYNIIAWGLAVERLAGLLFTIKDIRDLIGSRCDYDFIRRYPFREVKFTG